MADRFSYGNSPVRKPSRGLWDRLFKIEQSGSPWPAIVLLQMPRSRLPAATSNYLTQPVRASLVRGNGTPATEAQRIERLEKVIEAMQQALDTQFKRIAAIQAELDHVKAKQLSAH
jgi:hypothetical protein